MRQQAVLLQRFCLSTFEDGRDSIRRINPFLTKMLPVSVSTTTGNKLDHHPQADLTTDASLFTHPDGLSAGGRARAGVAV